MPQKPHMETHKTPGKSTSNCRPHSTRKSYGRSLIYMSTTNTFDTYIGGEHLP